MSEIFFAHPHALLNKVHEVSGTIGPEKFFSSPDEEVKKAKEGFVGYFFTLVLKKLTGNDWWLAQYEKEFPDFDLISCPENPKDMALERIELVTVPDRCETFEAMIDIIRGKLEGKGYPVTGNYNLLIYVNHVKSEQWIRLLSNNLETYHPFKSIWTIHLLFKNAKEIKAAVAHKIRPFPMKRIEAYIDDVEIHKRQPLPSYLEEIEKDGKIRIVPKSDFINEFRKIAMRARLKTG